MKTAAAARHNLTREGYDVVVAPTGSDALKQAREVHPDLVLPPPGVETVRGVGYRFREPDRP
ncbi:MAG TPA: hypothetical protein VGT02_12215 [Methylomirabilota bacterium]|jgi:DNA-binding response OmpR family regulator|nr:hypothetical protein [Methylomirabilota bacterium]